MNKEMDKISANDFIEMAILKEKELRELIGDRIYLKGDFDAHFNIDKTTSYEFIDMLEYSMDNGICNLLTPNGKWLYDVDTKTFYRDKIPPLKWHKRIVKLIKNYFNRDKSHKMRKNFEEKLTK